MNDEQPKDYYVQSFEEILEETYKNSSLFVKIVYHLQDYILPALVIVFGMGYLAGTYFGKFW